MGIRPGLAAALPLAVFALLALISWNRWIEPYVDSGRELMVPWRLAHGERLYRDVHFHHGPLGPYLAAIVDTAAGPSLPARLGLCAAVALLHLAALGRVARRLLSPGRAALATALAVSTAFFLRPGGWLFPFSLDVALSVAALTGALALFTADPSPRRDAAIGACVLAALLARPEIGMAGAFVLAAAARRAPRRLVALAAAPILAAGAGYAALSVGIPGRTLVRDGWLCLIDPPEAFRNVYRAYAGLDRPGLRSAELLLALMVLALIGALLVASAETVKRLETSGHPAAARGAEAAGVAVLLAAAGVAARPPVFLAESLGLLPPLVRVVPPALVLAALWRAGQALRRARPQVPAIPDAFVWMSALFAARLLFAAAYVGPYDAFFLPLPLVVAAAALFQAADRLAPRVGRILPRLTAQALAVFVLFRGIALAELYRGIPWPLVRTPAGALRLPEPVASATAGALDALSSLPPSAALAGFPETGFFNYVLERRSPLWLEQFFPGHLDADAETRAIAVLAAHPPEALLRANVLAVGEGARAFGRDYDVRLDAAARAQYRTLAVFGPGARPGAVIGDPDFFVEISVPNERAPAAP
jgi:hypothetical protein